MNVEPSSGELFVIDIADHNIQVCILGMMQIIDAAAFQHIKFLPESGHQAGLDIDDLRIGVSLLKQLCYDSGGLPGLYQLAVDELAQFIVRKAGISGQPMVFLFGDQSDIFQLIPKRLHLLPDLMFDREVISFLTVFSR